MKTTVKTRNFKIGILVIGTFFLVYYGLNFLKGINIFSPSNYYYAQYENIEGLVSSSPVYIKGYKVGYVNEINYDFSQKKAFTIKVAVLKNLRLPLGSTIKLQNDGLVGGKAVELTINEPNKENLIHNPGDTLKSEVERSLFDELTNNMLPKFDQLFQHTDSLIQSLRVITEGENLTNSLKSLEVTTDNFAQSSAKIKSLLASDVPKIITKADSMFENLNQLSDNLKQINYAQTFSELDSTILNIKTLTEKLKTKDNSLGLLMNDKELYTNIISITANIDSLMLDLKTNPKRYVHFSVFGKKN